MKSYNKRALRGNDYNDAQWQQDMMEMGVYVPDDMLYTPEGPKYVMRRFYEQNKKDYMAQAGMSAKEAEETAMGEFKAAMQDYERLLK